MSDDYKKIKIECYGTVIRGNEDTSEDQLASVHDNEFGLLLTDRFNAYDANQERIKELEARNTELKVAMSDLIDFANMVVDQESLSTDVVDDAIKVFNKENK